MVELDQNELDWILEDLGDEYWNGHEIVPKLKAKLEAAQEEMNRRIYGQQEGGSE